jgi:membrane protein DedA with SNARE-associated domain
MLRSITTTALEVAGAVAVCVGAFLAWTPLGFIVSGAIVTGAGYLLAGDE